MNLQIRWENKQQRGEKKNERKKKWMEELKARLIGYQMYSYCCGAHLFWQLMVIDNVSEIEGRQIKKTSIEKAFCCRRKELRQSREMSAEIWSSTQPPSVQANWVTSLPKNKYSRRSVTHFITSQPQHKKVSSLEWILALCLHPNYLQRHQ